MCQGRVSTMPGVVHAHWQAPDGRTAVALANWSAEAQTIAVMGEAARAGANLHLRGERGEDRRLAPARRRQLSLPPLSVALLEYDAGDTAAAAISAASKEP